jgi:hypothetical protein
MVFPPRPIWVVGACDNKMAQQFLYSVSTKLNRDQVWELLIDIENWTRLSAVYQQLAWEGEPWVRGSTIVGTLSSVRLWWASQCSRYRVAAWAS